MREKARGGCALMCHPRGVHVTRREGQPPLFHSARTVSEHGKPTDGGAAPDPWTDLASKAVPTREIQTVAPLTRTRPYSRMEAADELDTVIEAARGAVRRRSLRTVAREIGMSPTGLRGLLDGASPYDKTRDRLRAWYAREEGLDRLPTAAAADMILSLVRGVPNRSAGAHLVLDAVEAAHAAGSVPPPQWLAPVRARLSPPPAEPS